MFIKEIFNGELITKLFYLTLDVTGEMSEFFIESGSKIMNFFRKDKRVFNQILVLFEQFESVNFFDELIIVIPGGLIFEHTFNLIDFIRVKGFRKIDDVIQGILLYFLKNVANFDEILFQ